ncbi:MAG: NifU family protein [Bacteroidota bacterium]|nr:NifU family protein [Bacteroidota bacterium]
MDKEQEINIIKIALELIKPYLQKDGGDIFFVDLTDDNILKVSYSDNCKNCKFKEQTKLIIEKQIRKVFPNLKKMVEVDD